MNTKTIIISIVMLILGLLIGKFFLGNTTSTSSSNTAVEIVKVEEHWTCSMHPQIDLPEQTPCPLCGMDLIPMEEDGGETLDPNQFKMNDYAMSLANIQTIKIGTSSGNRKEIPSLNLSGRIVQNENNKQLQTAHVGGRIEQLNYKTEGEYIKKGSVIAMIYSPELVVAQNELIQALEIKDVQPELYKAIRQKLKHWMFSEHLIEELEKTKKVLIDYPLMANVSGTITKKYIEEGNHVMEGHKMFEVSNLSSLWAEFDVFERDLSSVSRGNMLSISPSAYPDKKIKAKINFVNPILDSKTRTIKVRATINNRGNKLKPGMILTAEMPRKIKNNAKSLLSIPKTAVLWTGLRSIVYIKPIQDKSIFELREVELGAELGDQYEVLSGLENGEELVVNGTFTLDATAQLNNKASMMNTLELGVQEEEKEKVPDYKSSTPKGFKKQLGDYVLEYLKLKDAFVLTNAESSSDIAKNLLGSFKNMDMSLLDGDAHMYWMTQLNGLKAHCKNISESTKIEEQRKQFEFVTIALLNSIRAFGTDETTFYIQHCPMAFDNTGADWISSETNIRNPYFGDLMMTCGVVKDTLSN